MAVVDEVVRRARCGRVVQVVEVEPTTPVSTGHPTWLTPSRSLLGLVGRVAMGGLVLTAAMGRLGELLTLAPSFTPMAEVVAQEAPRARPGVVGAVEASLE